MTQLIKLFFILFSFVLTSGKTTVFAENFTTVKVSESAIKALPHCIDYELKAALCVWVKVSLSGVLVTITPKVRHKLPDFVVTAFTNGGETPWTEVRMTEGIVAKQIQQSAIVKAGLGTNMITYGSMGNGVSQGQVQNQNTRFNEVNVVGNPAIKLIQKEIKKLLGGASFLCDSNVVPLKPYYMSELDTVAWRMPKIEILKYPLNMIPGKREVTQSTSLLGGAVQTWGSIFPRTGFVLQQQLSKAAAVSSQRAIDIVLHKKQIPHIYKHYKVTANATFIRHLATPEINKSWQMIEPKTQKFCEAFGANTNPDWGEGKHDTKGDFAWNYWNEYECCMPGPGKLVFHYDF